MSKRKRYNQHELTRKDFLRMIRVDTGEMTVAEICKEDRMSRRTYYNRRNRMKDMDFKSYLDYIGVTDAALAKKIFDGLDATKPSIDPNVKEAPDMLTRHRYLVTALQLKGHLTKDEASSASTSIIIQIVQPKVKDTDTGGRIFVKRALLADPGKSI